MREDRANTAVPLTTGAEVLEDKGKYSMPTDGVDVSTVGRGRVVSRWLLLKVVGSQPPPAQPHTFVPLTGLLQGELWKQSIHS